VEKIGIIVGGGSGPILAEVLINFLKRVGEEKYGLEFEFYVNSYSPVLLIETEKEGEKWYKLPEGLEIEPFSTYTKADEHSPEKIKEETDKIIDLLKAWHKKGIKYIFRTSINADVLYKLRQKVKAVKIITSTFNNNKVLIIRDEFQGFYANDTWKYEKDKEEITGTFHFSKEGFKDLIDIANEKAVNFFGEKKIDKKLFIYKHHLFDGHIKKWIEGKNYEILQPDTGSSETVNKLIEENKNHNLLILASNEFGDVIYEFLLNLEGKIRYKIALFTENYYLKYPKFIVYQTVHGSADDKEPEAVLPIATIRIAAKILSEIIKNTKILSRVNAESKTILIDYLIKNELLEQQSFSLYTITNQIIKTYKYGN